LTDFVTQPQVELLTQSDSQVELSLTIPENLYYFQGHFPEAAILPGVAQLDWVMQYLAQFFGVDITDLVSVDALKFKSIIRPNYQITLTLTQIKANKFGFNYHSNHAQHASGKVVFS